MKKITIILILLITIFSCKNVLRSGNTGSFELINLSDKEVEFIWIAPEGTLYPIANSLSILKGKSFKIEGLDFGDYDIAIDFKNEFNSFNSKKDKSKLLIIKRNMKTIWFIAESGEIIANKP